MNTKIEALENQLFKYFGEDYKDAIDVNLFDLDTIKLPKLDSKNDMGDAFIVRNSIINQIECTLFMSVPLLLKDPSIKELIKDVYCCKKIIEIIKNEIDANWFNLNRDINIKKMKLDEDIPESIEKNELIKIMEDIKYL